MTNILEIQAAITKLQAQAEAIKVKDRNKVLSEIVTQMHAFGITVKDLQSAITAGTKGRSRGKGKATSKAAGKRTNKLAGAKVVAKYKGPNGETWTGRGIMPKWMDVLVKAGQAKESFLIEAAPAA